ncbi:hypothetical protein PR048_002198 [Dryococelus australis]|uniref:Reverse transcriptase domain-containing protein n=1 Tax=Dryococelus australis TaxID=614101 RepID=A0ABQ9IJI1_9NEOP|nr:hypothetical protein PR048_002198 [Dryococelus australis]
MADWRNFVSFVNDLIDELPKVTEDTVLVAYKAFYTFILSVVQASMAVTHFTSTKRHFRVSWWTAECEEVNRHRLTALHRYKALSTLENFLILKEVWSKSNKSAWADFCQSFTPTTLARQLWNAFQHFFNSRTKRYTLNLTDDLVKKWMAYIAPDLVPPISSFVLPFFRPRQTMQDIVFHLGQTVRPIVYTDDIVLWMECATFQRVGRELTYALTQLENWLDIHSLNLSLSNSCTVYFTRKCFPQCLPLPIGMVLKRNEKWDAYVLYTEVKCYSSISILKSLAHYKWGADPVILHNFYITAIRTVLQYGCQVIQYLSQRLVNKLGR